MTASSANNSWRCFLFFAFCKQKVSKNVGFMSFLLIIIAFLWKIAIKKMKIIFKKFVELKIMCTFAMSNNKNR